jgi:hypothetical protein
MRMIREYFKNNKNMIPENKREKDNRNAKTLTKNEILGLIEKDLYEINYTPNFEE